MKFDSHALAKKIGWSVAFGIITGLVLYFTGYAELSKYTSPVGQIFIRLLKMIIIPLVFSSVFIAILNLGDPKNLGRMGSKAIIFYTITTSIAVMIGIVYANLFRPGADAGLVNKKAQAELAQSVKLAEANPEKEKGLVSTIVDVFVTAIPTNPVEAMSSNNMLQVIVFAMIFGLAALFYQKDAGPIIQLMHATEVLSQHVTHGIMMIAPIGVFALMIDVVANSGLDALYSLSKYMLVVLFGLFTHTMILTTFGASKLKTTPLNVFRQMSSAILTAFSTSSSAATLPVTLSCVTENLKVREKTANFVLPLGSTINMDGTATYVAVATIFIAQAYGIELSLTQNVIIFVTASLAAVGAAAIPGAGLITMGIVLGAVGLPVEGIQLVIAVDRILDMFRTITNIMGDAVGSMVVDSMLVKQEEMEARLG
jgi:Na+/H+-dicarboxylate symporter